MTLDFEHFISEVRGNIDTVLSQWLEPNQSSPQFRLQEAMYYSVLNGGKRIRPALCFASAIAVSGESVISHAGVLAAASAVELVHAYSLVHDDLPAMDDDDLRRGKPTTHIAFDEATALLAGDALQTKAFELLANADQLSAEAKVGCIQELTLGAGETGMCGGQMVDLQAVGNKPNLDELSTMHRLKTGALIRCSVLIGARACDEQNEEILNNLTTFAEAAGLAFQIKDDILDETADTETLGKRQGADAERGKPTYVSHLGLDGAQAKLDDLHQQANDALAPLGKSSTLLSELTNYIVHRAA